jgi:hypothetical protein
MPARLDDATARIGADHPAIGAHRHVPHRFPNPLLVIERNQRLLTARWKGCAQERIGQIWEAN